ncbi:hypothetical protein C7M84_001191 [Penaeus vannamei]|uniref:Uncharacterized protein n=1 Tax=Penaeus vannamei TaxID=6689 RepID=A0A423TUF7_PENVA|nr:hypothetical protein C7M84_001191 [Penaeus vannamei]
MRNETISPRNSLIHSLRRYKSPPEASKRHDLIRPLGHATPASPITHFLASASPRRCFPRQPFGYCVQRAADLTACSGSFICQSLSLFSPLSLSSLLLSLFSSSFLPSLPLFSLLLSLSLSSLSSLLLSSSSFLSSLLNYLSLSLHCPTVLCVSTPPPRFSHTHLPVMRPSLSRLSSPFLLSLIVLPSFSLSHSNSLFFLFLPHSSLSSPSRPSSSPLTPPLPLPSPLSLSLSLSLSFSALSSPPTPSFLLTCLSPLLSSSASFSLVSRLLISSLVLSLSVSLIFSLSSPSLSLSSLPPSLPTLASLPLPLPTSSFSLTVAARPPSSLLPLPHSLPLRCTPSLSLTPSALSLHLPHYLSFLSLLPHSIPALPHPSPSLSPPSSPSLYSSYLSLLLSFSLIFNLSPSLSVSSLLLFISLSPYLILSSPPPSFVRLIYHPPSTLSRPLILHSLISPLLYYSSSLPHSSSALSLSSLTPSLFLQPSLQSLLSLSLTHTSALSLSPPLKMCITSLPLSPLTPLPSHHSSHRK